jgi:hypothetical protein
MKNYKRYIKIAVAITIIPISWLLYPFLTYGSDSIHDNIYLLPLFIYIGQLVTSILLKSKKLLILTFFNPAFLIPFLYILIPVINYVAKKPTIITCSYHAKEKTLDSTKSVYVMYDDDDCDCDGMYKYSHNVNNFVTYKLINWFGNPLAKNK